jgi:hypothetical protein
VVAQEHRGQLDTDGILSPGEIRNPRIDYRYSKAPYGNPPYGQSSSGYFPYEQPHDGRNIKNDRNWNSNFREQHQSRYDFSRFESDLWHGVQSGRISSREQDELRYAQEDLRRREYTYRQDGRVTSWEQEDLNSRASGLRGKLDHELGDGEQRWLR